MSTMDLNRVTIDDLETVPGVTRTLARRIIAARDLAGGFASLAGLRDVSGVTTDLYATLGQHLGVERRTALAASRQLLCVLDPRGEHRGRYRGYRVSARFVTRVVVAGSDETVATPSVQANETDADGLASLTLPEAADLDGDVGFTVRAADGEIVLSDDRKGADLGRRVDLAVVPRDLPITQPTDDPGFQQPKKLRGRVIDREGRVQIAGKQVVIWTTLAAEPGAGDYRAVMVATTDATGYFSGAYPLGRVGSAQATVALDPGVGQSSQAVPIHLDDGALPADLIVVVDLPRRGTPLGGAEGEGDCHCGPDGAPTPRDPDSADLVQGVYSSDIGQGRCVDFTRPDRTLQEFHYSYVVRTTEPTVRGLTLAEPRRIPPGLVSEIVKLAELAQFQARVDAGTGTGTGTGAGIGIGTGAGIAIDAGDRSASLARAATDGQALALLQASDGKALAGLELHADLWRDTVTSPEKADLGAILGVARASKFRDIVRAIDLSLSGGADRSRLSCRNAVEWDRDATIYEACTIAHGHLLQFKQEWVADGYSMGRLLYSLPLAPGQKKQIAVLDWERRESALREESLVASESLQATLSRDRDIGEMVSSVLTESSRGGSSAITAGIAGGGGLGFIGNAVGGLLGVGGGVGGASSSAWQDSARNVTGSSLQTLRDRTSQAAAAMRAQRSTVIQTVSQGERVAVTTESVVNYNHCHAMTIEYFEVLRHLIVRQRLVGVQECLFVPLRMSRFDRAKALRWRTTLRPLVPEASLRQGFDALERIQAAYVGSDLPVGAYADDAIESLEGELTIRFQLARPRDESDDFHPPNWQWMALLLPMVNAQELYRNFLKGQALKDRIFFEQLGGRIARAFVDLLNVAWVDSLGVEHRLPIDPTLLSNFSNDTGLTVSLRLGGNLPAVARKDIRFLQISQQAFLGIPFASVLPAGSRAIIEGGEIRYRTAHFSGRLFRSARVANDLTGSDDVRIATPLTREELRRPREEDKELGRRLLDHLNENLERYHHGLWRGLSPDRLYLLLDGFEAPNSGGRSVASVVDNQLIGIIGNSLILPVSRGFHLDPTFRQDAEQPIDLLEHYQPTTPIEPIRVAIPTRGVYAEAVMGACNACERKEEDRFWRWEESPIPDQPPSILPVSTDTRQTATPDLTARDFPAPIIAMQSAPAAPDPTGLASALSLLGQADAFRDLTGLQGNQQNAANALKQAFDSAQFFGGKAADLALQGRMAKDIDKTMRTIQAARTEGLLTDAQAQELTRNAISGMIGSGARAEDSEKLTSVPEVKEAIQKASDAAGGEIAMSRATASGRENVEVKIPGADASRSWIIEPADRQAWARARSFGPGGSGGDRTGQTRLSVRTRPVPEGGSLRWSVPPSQAGRFTLAGGAQTQAGLVADITGLRPGLTAIDFDVLDADGRSVESQKYPLSIPQFISVAADPSFTAVLNGYGLIDVEIAECLTEARDVCHALLAEANVRTVWIALGESLPVHLAAGQPGHAMVSDARFVDASPGGGLYGRCFPPFGPNVFNETIRVFAKGFEEVVSGTANDHVDNVTSEVVRTLVTAGQISSPAKSLGIRILGRLYGETLAHEIGHSLIGTTLDSTPHHDHNAAPGVAGDLMNLGTNRSFEQRTGCSLNGGRVAAPLEDNVDLLPGIPAINIFTGRAKAELERHFPVPPVFR